MRPLRCVVALVIGVVTASIGVYIAAQVAVNAAAREAGVTEDIAAPVVIVLGASVKPDGTPSDVLADRLRVAVALYDAGRVQKILASGDHGAATYDEVSVMKDFLLSHGVEADDIFLDHAGFDTYDTMYRARHLFGVTDAFIATQSFHLPRALYLGQAMGMTVYGASADLHPYVKEDMFALRERFANVKAFIDVVRGAKPSFLGSPFDISGDGQVTWGE